MLFFFLYLLAMEYAYLLSVNCILWYTEYIVMSDEMIII